MGYNKEVPLYNKGQKQDLSNIIQDNLGTVIFKHDDFPKWTDADGEKQLDNYTVYAEYNRECELFSVNSVGCGKKI